MTAQKTVLLSSNELATGKMETAVAILMENVDKYYGKSQSEMTKENFIETKNSFVKIQMLIPEFISFWIDATSTGRDAILSVHKVQERIDVILFRTGKLDFQKMRLLISQLSLARIHLEGLDNILLHLAKFIDLCRGKHDEIVSEMKIIEETLDRARTCLKDDAETFREALEMYNLYYSPLVATKAFWIASISLCISSLAFLLTLLRALGLF
jgi:hypothetical protein